MSPSGLRVRVLRSVALMARLRQLRESLGFSDTPYFIRFFRRHAGVTPGEFRAARGSAISDRLRPLPERDG